MERSLKWVAVGCGITASIIGLFFLAEWLCGQMTYAGRDAITMKTNASLCLFVCGAAIVLAVLGENVRWASRLARLFAFCSILVGGLTVLEHVGGWDFGIDQLLAREAPGAMGITHPNRMGPPAAFSFTVCGVIVVLLTGKRRMVRAAQWLGIVLCVVGLLGILAYLYHVKELYGAVRYATIAWQSALAVLLLGLGILCARPREGLMGIVTARDPGGVALRRLFLPAVLLPIVLGWLRLQGEWHGLYERYFGTSILILSLILVFSFLVYHTAARLRSMAAAEQKALEKLQRTQAMLLEAESLSHTGAWEWEPATDLWYLSDEWLRIHGVATTTLRHEELLTICHPDDCEAVREAFEALRSGKKQYRMEYRIIRQDSGEIRAVKAQGQFVKDETGRVVRVYGFVQDISEQKRAEDEARIQRQLLESVVNELPAGVVIVRGSDFRVLVANPAYALLAPGKEMPGNTLQEVWPEAYAHLGAIFRHVLATGEVYHAEDDPFELRRSPSAPLEKRYFTWSVFRVQLPGDQGYGVLATVWETTDRKASEQAVRESEKRLRSVIEHLAEGLIVIDPEGGTLHWNRKALELYHYSGHENEIAFFDSLVNLYELRTLDGEVVPVEEWPIKRIMRGEEYRDYELIVSHRRKEWQRVYDFSGGIIRGGAGAPDMGLLTMRDITDRKAAEDALRQSEGLLRKVLETLPVAVWILGRDGTVQHANKAAHDIWAGVKYVGINGFGEYTGWWLDSGKLIEPEKWAGARAIRKGETSLNEEVRIQCFDGTQKIILNSAAPIRNEKGEITGAITIQQDITTRKEAEDALRESEKKFRAVFQHAAVGMGRVSFTDARWIDVNEAFCDMLGYSPEEFKATPWPQMTHPEDVDLDLVPFQRMAAGELETYNVEKRFFHKDGHLVWVRLTLSMVRNSQGDPDYEIAVIEDITYRKEAEESLRKAKDELEVRVRERTRELEQAYEHLKHETEERIAAVENLRRNEHLLIQQSRLAAMGEMLGNIAHQWRQPLNILGLLIQQLPMTFEMGRLTQEQLEQDVEKAMQVILHMSQTINDFRDFLQEEKEKKPFSVNHAVATTISLFEATLRTMDVELELKQGTDLFINGHRNEFCQVLMNIITNARDAFRERNTPSPRIVISIFKEKEKVIVTIADNAGGIAEAIMDRIFDPYFTTKGPDKGTGIGLFMSKNIIEKSMQGTLTVRNTADGAEFRIEV